MNTRKIETTVGLFVLIGLIAVAALAVTVGGGALTLAGGQTFSARFTNAAGLKSGSSVRIAGVTVGEVKSVTLRQDDYSAIVTLRVNASLRLDDDTVAAVRSSGLLGDKFIALKPGSSGTALPAGGTIIDTESTIDLEDLIARFAFGSVDKKK